MGLRSPHPLRPLQAHPLLLLVDDWDGGQTSLLLPKPLAAYSPNLCNLALFEIVVQNLVAIFVDSGLNYEENEMLRLLLP